VTAVRLTLHGAWPLVAALRAYAANRGMAVAVAPAIAAHDGPVLRWECGSSYGDVRLPDAATIRDRLVRRVVGQLVAGIDPHPTRLTGVVLAPAGGVCGPAEEGPVDAVRQGVHMRFLAGEPPSVPASLRVLEIQHTRCWISGIHLSGPGMHAASRRAAGVLGELPVPLCGDTARAVEHLTAMAYGPDWVGVHLLALRAAGAQQCYAEVVFCETELVRALLESVIEAAGGGSCESA
jgi:hypothetical protein